jgi:MoaA/NifB/PqqE/SkfB family radical SAM enzyme
MIAISLFRLAMAHARNALAEEIYLRTGTDRTRPISFHALINERCNARCRFCKYWRLPRYAEELTIAEWEEALGGIRDFVGAFHINFSGGEPFLKEGFTRLLGWCSGNGILAGVTTNGAMLDGETCREVMEARPFNINLSVDTADPELHDWLRGCPGLFDTAREGIGRLRRERERVGAPVRIIIKTVINGRNFEGLPALVRWVGEVGADGILFQPVEPLTSEVRRELWIEEEARPHFGEIIEELIAMQEAGAPILSSPAFLRRLELHFRGTSAPEEAGACRVGLRSLHLQPDGAVELCYKMPAIGNLRTQSVREIWRGPEARARRRETVHCSKLCLCMGGSLLSLREKVAQRLRLGC